MCGFDWAAAGPIPYIPNLCLLSLEVHGHLEWLFGVLIDLTRGIHRLLQGTRCREAVNSRLLHQAL
jgi:hypothetical protein